ncbi:MAG: hypothetical protein AAGD10_05885 [Myxococcota bacterium]
MRWTAAWLCLLVACSEGDPLDPAERDLGTMDAGRHDQGRDLGGPADDGGGFMLPDMGPPPDPGAWSGLPPAPEGSGRTNSIAVWGGGRVWIWGGTAATGVPSPAGLAFEPATASWIVFPEGSGAGTRSPCVAWMGDRLFVAGAMGDAAHSAAIWDPATDTWTPLGSPPQDEVRSKPACVWTGREVLMWGGDAGGTGFAWNVEDQAWRAMAPLSGASDVYAVHGEWMGDEAAFIWGGSELVIYDPASDAWRRATLQGAPIPGQKSLAWTGDRLLVWGEAMTFFAFMSGGIYDPAEDSWTEMNRQHGLVPRTGFNMAWTGRELLIWAGDEIGGQGRQFRNGALYDPMSDDWRPIATEDAPAVRSFAVGVWTGSAFFYWSGSTFGPLGNLYRNDGGRYFK